MAAVPAHSGTVKGAAAKPGEMPPAAMAAPQSERRVLTAADVVSKDRLVELVNIGKDLKAHAAAVRLAIKEAHQAVRRGVPAPAAANALEEDAIEQIEIETLVSEDRQQELIALAESGEVENAIRLAVQDAFQATRTGVQVDVESPAESPQHDRAAAKAISAAMQTHFRDKINYVPSNYTLAWKDAKLSIRFLNHMSPLMLGVIQRPGSSADLSERKAALTYLNLSTDALASVMSSRVAPNQNIGLYERVELNSMLSHLVGKMWESSGNADPQKNIDELLLTVASVYSDEAFLNRHNQVAALMLNAGGYARVDSPETMASRLSLSMHQVCMNFYQAVTDPRLQGSKGAYYTYGKSRVELVKDMLQAFDEVAAQMVVQHRFSESLSNDQRTTMLQAWIRNAASIFQGEYVAQTIRHVDWFREGQKESHEKFLSRFEEVKKALPAILKKTGEVTLETINDLIAVAIEQSVECIDDKPKGPTTSPH